MDGRRVQPRAAQLVTPHGAARRPRRRADVVVGYQGFDRIERRDQRVDLFATNLKDGESTVSYLVRAVTPGTFFAAPTRAEAMYQPEVAGRGTGETITVTPEP
jgi:uncharacterized protein YfaS (alpha-2-macroglobulin family)